jgi:hypothetical protein
MRTRQRGTTRRLHEFRDSIKLLRSGQFPISFHFEKGRPLQTLNSEVTSLMTDQMQDNQRESKRAYIVTEDLSLLVARWCKTQQPEIPIEKLDGTDFFENILKKLADALREHCFDEKKIEVVTLQRSAFADLLRKNDTVYDERLQANDPNRTPSEFWVCLDDVYLTPLHDKDAAKYNLSITRYVDPAGKSTGQLNHLIGHGSRPEGIARTLHFQVRECINKWEDTKDKYRIEDLPIVLVDDGTFTGETVCHVLTEFAKLGVIINSVRLGVAKRKAIEMIANWTPPPNVDYGDKGEGMDRVYFIGASKLCPPIKDWVCERDFFPGVLYAGKVVARRGKDGSVQPLRVGLNQIPVRAQYLYGWGHPHQWASIEEDVAEPFTAVALELSIQLWTQLEKLWGRTILVQDLPAVPHKLLRDFDYNEIDKYLEKPWLEVLEEELKSVRRGLALLDKY